MTDVLALLRHALASRPAEAAEVLRVAMLLASGLPAPTPGWWAHTCDECGAKTRGNPWCGARRMHVVGFEDPACADWRPRGAP